MKNNATRAIRSEEITIDVRICAALAANRGGVVYLAAIAPDMELTDRKSTRLNSSHTDSSRMPSSA